MMGELAEETLASGLKYGLALMAIAVAGFAVI
jgi:hypothetical protein